MSEIGVTHDGPWTYIDMSAEARLTRAQERIAELESIVSGRRSGCACIIDDDTDAITRWCHVHANTPRPAESCPAGSPQTDHGASIAACAQQDRYPLLYALIQSGADVCAAIEAVLTERTT